MADDATGQDQERRLDEVLAGYVQAVEAGWAPDRRELVARNPDLAAEIEEFLDDYERINRVAGPLRALAGAAREDFIGESGPVGPHRWTPAGGDGPTGPAPHGPS